MSHGQHFTVEELNALPWRPLLPDEAELLGGLLALDFEGAEELLAQVPETKARRGCTCGCGTLSLLVDRDRCGAAPSGLANPIPAEANVIVAGAEIVGGVIVFHDDGWLDQIEVYSFGDEPLPLPRVRDVTWRVRAK